MKSAKRLSAARSMSASLGSTALRTSRRAPDEAPKPKGILRILSFAGGLTAVTLVLTLLSYGYDFGYLNAFGLVPEQLNRSPLDFLLRSHRAVLVWMRGVDGIRNEILSWDFARRVFWELGFFAGFVVAFVVPVVVYLCQGGEPRRFVRRVAGWKGWRAAWFVAAIQVVRAKLTTSRLVGYLGPLGGFASVFAFTYVVAGVLWFVGGVFFLIVAFFPILPASAADRWAHEHVIDPAKCAVPAQPGRLAVQGAPCVRVIRLGCELARGRLIDFAGNNRVWLLHKRSRNAFSVPLDNSIVEDVDSDELPPPAGTVPAGAIRPNQAVPPCKPTQTLGTASP